MRKVARTILVGFIITAGGAVLSMAGVGSISIVVIMPTFASRNLILVTRAVELKQGPT